MKQWVPLLILLVITSIFSPAFVAIAALAVLGGMGGWALAHKARKTLREPPAAPADVAIKGRARLRVVR